jgi:hypothetical protein
MLVVICYGGENGGVIGRLELEAGQSIAVPRGTRTIQVIDHGIGLDHYGTASTIPGGV